jgi:hypothetical protein
MSGFGSQPNGSSPYGIGTPAVSSGTGGKLLRDTSTGRRMGSRRIDPFTKDYVLDENGRILGMNNTQQLVLMAVSTDKGSSAMRSLGQELRRIERITSNFARRVDTTLRACVQHIVDLGLIEVLGTRVEIVRPGVSKARLLWRDLESGVENETFFGDKPAPMFAGGGSPIPPVVEDIDPLALLLETGDELLTEGGDTLLIES